MIHSRLVIAISVLAFALTLRAASLETGPTPMVFPGSGENARAFAATGRGDFANASFQAEVTVTLKGGGGPGCAFFGLGSGKANPGQYHVPSTTPAVYCMLAPSDFAGGEVDGGCNSNMAAGGGDAAIGDGTHRIRMTWDAAGKRALFQICRNWAPGKTFRADSTFMIDAGEVTFGDEGHLFVGGAGGVKFSDFSAKPISAAEITVIGFGDSFPNDPTAGTWLPAAPVDHDGMRVLACWYSGPKLAATRAFANGAVTTQGSRWHCDTKALPVPGEPDAEDISLTFTLAQGAASSAGVAVAFDFADWSPDNYVMIPCSVYNGNRNRIVGGGYSEGLPKEDWYRKDMPLTTRDLPHLSLTPGVPSKLEVLACNTGAPAVCALNRHTGRAFILLAEQGIRAGDNILDNAFSVEESADRTRAAIVVSAPGVREAKPEFIGFSASPDRGMRWAAGDSRTLRLRLYRFDAKDIPGLFDKFMSVRKDVTGPNHPRDLFPMSEVEKLMTARIDSRYYQGKDSQFYCPENAPWISFGWIGGLMNTFPMLALGDPMHLDRVTKTFDFAIPHAQGAAGYFYGMLNHDGICSGREGYPDPKIVLTRKNADVLYWMMKQFILLKVQGRGDAIKPAWESGMRRLADAFVSTWKKDGQWGNFLHVDTGEVVIYNSTSAAQAMGGMALASRFYNNAEYLQVAIEAANFYYQRDFLGWGATTGHSGDTLQNADGDSPMAFAASLESIYEVTGDRAWIEKARNILNLQSSWTTSFDYQLPKTTELGGLGAKLAGVIWASTQNKHAAPGHCTSAGEPLFKVYRATGDTRYAELLRDIWHAYGEGIRGGGEITERLTYCDAEMRGYRGGGSTGWTETNGAMMAIELPGIYVCTDADRFYVFDSVKAQVMKRDATGVTLSITNPTKYDAAVSVFAENLSQASRALGYTAFLKWPKVHVKSGGTIQIRITSTGALPGQE